MRYKASFNSSSRHQVCRDSGIKRCLASLSFEFTEFRTYQIVWRNVKLFHSYISPELMRALFLLKLAYFGFPAVFQFNNETDTRFGNCLQFI